MKKIFLILAAAVVLSSVAWQTGTAYLPSEAGTPFLL